MRRIFLDVPHSVDPKFSWSGELVGHCENGEPVVDTIGFPDQHELDFVDDWRSLPGPVANAPDRTPAPLADGRSQPAPALEAAGLRLM